MDTKVMACTPSCTNTKSGGAIFQNERYKEKRVFNPVSGETKETSKWRCTVCGETKSNG
jgi:hypothetical protein